MELKSNSWYAEYYKIWYGTSILPISLCSFFWKLILAIVLFPISYLCIVDAIIFKDKTIRVKGSTAITFYILGLMTGTLSFLFISDKQVTALFIFVLMPILGYIVILLMFFIGYIITKILEVIPKSNKEYKSSNNWFTEGVKSFFGKYCPKITWK